MSQLKQEVLNDVAGNEIVQRHRRIPPAEDKNGLSTGLTLHSTWYSTDDLFSYLCGLDDSEVIHAGYAGTHGCSEACCTKLHPGGEAFPQSLDGSFFHQVLHQRQCFRILDMKRKDRRGKVSLVLQVAAKWCLI